MPASLSAVVLIPARLASTRLPDKPLAPIEGEPMIVHVWRRAVESDVGPVVVACADRQIARAVEAAGGHAVMTRPDHPSGSDRIHEALAAADPDRQAEVVINLQGDLPAIDPGAIRAVLLPLEDPDVDIATLASEIIDLRECESPDVVKAVVGFARGSLIGRALYFSRNPAPWGEGPLFHHIGIYGYRRAALERFVALPPSPLEARERLEQLRALDAGMRIDVALVDTIPLGVDTPADLEQARRIMAARRERGARLDRDST